MTTVLTPPPQPAGTTTPPSAGALVVGPQPYRWTVAEYQLLHRRGLLSQKRTILIDGEVLEMPNPGPPHTFALRRLDLWLLRVCPPGHHVRNQASFDVGTRHDPGPDLAVVPGVDNDYLAAAPRAATLIVELADSSLFLDTTTKAELYATAGVPDYWVLDLEHRQLLVFRDPEPLPEGLGATAYRTRLTYGTGESVSPLAGPHATITVADLLP